MTTQTALSAELVERIDMLREHVEQNIDLWTTIGSLVDIDSVFDAETHGLDDDALAWVMEASGYEALHDLFALVVAAISRRSGHPAPDHVETLRVTHPEWFSAEMVGPTLRRP